MGKTGGFLTPKAIANRIKSKGLQKLRWYCQLCQKQCRDENGFKCHCNSESHKRQMALFGQDPERIVEDYSNAFEENFLNHLRISHPRSRVLAKMVWNEFIADRDHIHMNSTKWTTLTEFVKYLGREGKCKVEETEKGWYITLIQKDAAQELADQQRGKRERHEREEETRAAKALQEQVERAEKYARTDTGPSEGSALERGEHAEPLHLAVDFAKRKSAPSRLSAKPSVAGFGDDIGEAGPFGKHSSKSSKPERHNALEELMKKDQAQKAAKRVDCWLTRNIVVKVMAKELKSEGYYKQKGVVEKVLEGNVGEISMLDSGDILRVHQAQLETVIPKQGGEVAVVNGAYRGTVGTLREVDFDKFKGQVMMKTGKIKGELVWLDYEDFCKI